MMTKGDVYYGLHFYAGVAQYEDGSRVFLNEDTLRTMDPSFAGCPVFVEHVDSVDPSIDVLRSEADGWVTESFYNAADGKHWAKFMVCSERGQKAVKTMKLSNCYHAEQFGPGGEWNGVPFEKQILNGRYEHLALVSNPRYAESVIMTPEEFKAYNAKCLETIERLSNNKEEPRMKLNFFTRTKVENSVDIEKTLVELPKSKLEIAISELIKNADDAEMARGVAKLADMKDEVEIDGVKMTVEEMIAKFMEMSKPKNEDEGSDDGEDMENSDAAEEEEMKPNLKPEDEKKNADEAAAVVAAEKKKNADMVRNAHKGKEAASVGREVRTMRQEVEIGKQMFGA